MSTGRSDILTPTPDDQLGRLALIEAVRALNDSVQRLARHSEAQDAKAERHAIAHDAKFDGLKDQLAEIKTSIAVIEKSGLKAAVDEHDRRLAVVEDQLAQRRGRDGVWAGFWRSPVAAWLTAAGVLVSGVFAWFKGGAGQ